MLALDGIMGYSTNKGFTLRGNEDKPGFRAPLSSSRSKSPSPSTTKVRAGGSSPTMLATSSLSMTSSGSRRGTARSPLDISRCVEQPKSGAVKTERTDYSGDDQRSVPTRMDSVDLVHVKKSPTKMERKEGQILNMSTQRAPSESSRRDSSLIGPSKGGLLTTYSKVSASSVPRAAISASNEINGDFGKFENAATLAESRYAEAQKRRRYSPGDRLSYVAERLDFQANKFGLAYYAISGCGPEIYIHGGQVSSAVMLNVSAAATDLVRWTASHGCVELESEDSPALVGHSMLYHQGSSSLIIYGGCGPEIQGLFSEVYIVTIPSGAFVGLDTSVPKPPGRARHAAAICGDKLYVHGGHCHRSGSRLLGDLWELDLVRGVWNCLPCDTVASESWIIDGEDVSGGLKHPGSRFGHHMTVYNEWLYICFGSDGRNGLTDMWAFHLEMEQWHRVIPKGRVSDSRVDCAACVVGKHIWLFHGGIDSTSGTMLNSFYEFNLRTHEGRQIRVELSVQPVKILPALMGHGMVCEDGENIMIFGGINRQGTIVHVVYKMKSTGKIPLGVGQPTAEILSRNHSLIMQEHELTTTENNQTDWSSSSSTEYCAPLELESLHKGPQVSPLLMIARTKRGSQASEVGTTDLLVVNHARNQSPKSPRSSQLMSLPDALRKEVENAGIAELAALRLENKELRRRLAELCHDKKQRNRNSGTYYKDIVDLMARTEEALGTFRHLGEQWAKIHSGMLLPP